VNQFLASGNIDGAFKKLVGAFVKASFYHCVIGAADDVAGRMRKLTRAIMCCKSKLRWLIALTCDPRYRCPLNRLPASRLLPPRSGLERSDFVHWPIPTKASVRPSVGS
jgi:hypothetical protein